MKCSSSAPALAEAWLLQDDIRQATEALGDPPEERERLHPARLSELWRLHGKLAIAQGEPSRGIALPGARAQAGRARPRLPRDRPGPLRARAAATARSATRRSSASTSPRRHRRCTPPATCGNLALVHSLSGVTLAQDGRLDEAMAALRQAERLALMVHAGDVVATVCGNQANVAMMQHRHDQALALAERSVELQEESGTPHGLGHRAGLARPDQRAARQPAPRRAGAQPRARRAQPAAVHARDDRRGVRHARADSPDSRQPRGRQPLPAAIARGLRRYAHSRWYQWSVRVLEARVALRRGDAATALAIADEIARAEDVPPATRRRRSLIAVEALLVSGRQRRGRGPVGGRWHRRLESLPA